MRKATLNFIVDTVAFLAFVLLASTGVLVRYVLPPGTGHSQTLWGLGRHDWGGVHFWIAVALLTALALHLFLHWRWVVAMIRGRPRDGRGDSGIRVALAVVALGVLIALVASPFVSPVEATGERGRGENAEHVEHDGPMIEGAMSLRDVETTTGVPASTIIEALGLPPDVSPDARLGPLRREHGFEMNDVREIVRQHLDPGP